MLSERFWKPEAVLRLALGVFVCVFIGALLVGALRHFVGPHFDDSPWRSAAATLCFQGAALLLIHYFVREHDLRWREAFGFHNQWKRAVFFWRARRGRLFSRLADAAMEFLWN